MVVSISTVSPLISRLTLLPAARDASRTMRTNGAKSRPTGPMPARGIWPRSSAVRRCTPPASPRTTRTRPASWLLISGRALGISPDPAGQEVEVVVTVELQLLEDFTQRDVAHRVPARRARLDVGQRTMRVLGLELGDRLRHARLRERQELAGLLELCQVTIEPTPGDDQLADQVHERVETVEADPDARASASGQVTGRPGRSGRAGGDQWFG